MNPLGRTLALGAAVLSLAGAKPPVRTGEKSLDYPPVIAFTYCTGENKAVQLLDSVGNLLPTDLLPCGEPLKFFIKRAGEPTLERIVTSDGRDGYLARANLSTGIPAAFPSSEIAPDSQAKKLYQELSDAKGLPEWASMVCFADEVESKSFRILSVSGRYQYWINGIGYAVIDSELISLEGSMATFQAKLVNTNDPNLKGVDRFRLNVATGRAIETINHKGQPDVEEVSKCYKRRKQ